MKSTFPEVKDCGPRMKHELSEEELAFVSLLQQIRFGWIDRLQVREGNPILRGAEWTRTVKLGADNTPHPALDKSDYELPQRLKELFKHTRTLGDGVLTRLEIRDGLPFAFGIPGSIPE